MKININLIAILIVLVMALSYYLVSLGSPIVFGDEGYYAAISRWISEELLLPDYDPVHSTDVFHMKYYRPPLYSAIGSFFWLIGGEAGMKFIIPLFSLLTSLVVYIFLKRHYNMKSGLAAMFILLSTPILITYSLLSYVETALTLFFSLALYFTYDSSDKRNLYLAGIFTGLAILTDIVGYVLLGFLIMWSLLKKFKNWKQIGTIIIIALVISTPWFLRNYAVFGEICAEPFIKSGCDGKIDIDLGIDENVKFDGIQRGGTASNFLDFGIMNFMNFLFGWTITIIFMFAISNVIVKRDDLSKFILLALLSILPLLYLTFGGRVEDAARFILPITVPVALLGGMIISDVYDKIKQKNIILVMVFILVFVLGTWFFAQGKIDGMKAVKGFVPSFFDGCDWIKKNTPEDSLIYAIYAHQAAYQCDRSVQAGVPDQGQIVLTYDNRSYEHLKQHGFDYVFIEGFTISSSNRAEETPIKFLAYLESSPDFNLIYDNTGTFGQSGIRIYEVL